MMNNLIKLDDICEEYFNMQPIFARRKAAMGILPVPAFRLTDTGRGPWFVEPTSLQNYVENRMSEASKLHRKMAGV